MLVCYDAINEQATSNNSFQRWFKIYNTDTVKYWKYQYISIKFWILSISIDISRTSVKSPSISIWRIKQYFPERSIDRYIQPRTTVTLLSCQLLSMCHFSTVYPPTHFPIRRGYIVLKSILVLCTPYVLENAWGGRQY